MSLVDHLLEKSAVMTAYVWNNPQKKGKTLTLSQTHVRFIFLYI